MSPARLDWQHRGEYIRTRSQRRPGDADIEPEWADEAFKDEHAIVIAPDPTSESGKTNRLIGYSPTAQMVIVVIYLPDGLIGVNAWRANETHTRRYWEGEAMKKKELKDLIERETKASEAARDAPIPDHAVRKGSTRSVVYSVRLTPEQTEEIQRIADEAGIPASGLVRGWVLQGLAAEREAANPESLVEALSRDVDRLRRSLGRRRAS